MINYGLDLSTPHGEFGATVLDRARIRRPRILFA
jgi:hypothetical protein